MRLGILASHPIQYYAPWFRTLAGKLDLMVYYAHRPSPVEQGKGFDVPFEWDRDLLAGYASEFLPNRARKPDVNRFTGCDTPAISDRLATGHFDLFLVTGWYLKSHWQTIRACRRHGVPVMVRGDSQLTTQRSRLKRLAKPLLYKYLLKQFDAFLSVGIRNREYLRHYGVPEERIFFSPHFVDTVWFRQQAGLSTNVETLRSLGCDPDKRTVLFVGKFIEKKRPLDLVEALQILKRRCPELKLQVLFIGAGELESEISQASRTRNLTVILGGFRNQAELPAIYAAADVLVLPSSGGETWGLVVNEAMACGTPAVVSSAVGCGPDLIESGLTGEVYSVGNTRQLAEALERMLARVPSRQVSQALDDKMQHYSIDHATSGLLEASEYLLKPGKQAKQ
jgi:glycosyltransferase involved in cell wall biosynthesis